MQTLLNIQSAFVASFLTGTGILMCQQNVAKNPVDLLPNGGFESKQQENNWPLNSTNSPNVELVTGKNAAHSGQYCVKLAPVQSPAGAPFPYQSAVNSIKVDVQGKKEYAVSLWFRSQDVTKTDPPNIISSLSVYWYSNDGTYIRHDNEVMDRDGSFSDWKDFTLNVHAPPNAAKAMTVINFYGSSGALYIDDVSFVSR